MKNIVGRVIDALACRAGVGRGTLSRIERIAVHMLFMLVVAERWPVIVRGVQGIVRELRGV